jgi:hypothetical protein
MLSRVCLVDPRNLFESWSSWLGKTFGSGHGEDPPLVNSIRPLERGDRKTHSLKGSVPFYTLSNELKQSNVSIRVDDWSSWLVAGENSTESALIKRNVILDSGHREDPLVNNLEALAKCKREASPFILRLTGAGKTLRHRKNRPARKSDAEGKLRL